MKSVFSIGSKQTDMEIFKYIGDRDIANVCLVSKSVNKLLNEDKYWLQRFFYIYKRYLKNVNINIYKQEKTWKQYYVDITTQIKTDFPYYSSAMALTQRRFDLIEILKNKFGAEPVQGLMTRDGNFIECYYTRNGKPTGTKEGPYFEVRLPEKDNNTVLDYDMISVFPYRTKKLYISDNIQYSLQFIENVKISEVLYENGNIISTTNWNRKGIKVYSEIINQHKKEIKEWFGNGDIKSECYYVHGKKDGVWYRWDKNGNKTSKYYDNGKAILTPAEKRAQVESEKAYENELQKLVDIERKNGF